MDCKVFKFGGSSIKDSERIAAIKDILKSYNGSKLVVVISAIDKTTNALEEVHTKYIKDEEGGLQLLDKVIASHLQLAEQLELDQDAIAKKLEALVIENISQIAGSKNPDLVYDQIISLGELFSTTIIVDYLKAQGLAARWMDVRHVIVTDNNYREGKVDLRITTNKTNKKVKKYLKDSELIITQGFIAKDAQGMTTTLGREGSDYTAAIFAYALDVEELTIWKDVPGILTADPRRFENVELLDRVSYREAIEMTYYGAKVIHPKTIQPIQNKRIKLQVRSFLNPNEVGTIIADPGMLSYPPVIVIQDQVILLQITSKDFSFIAEEHLSLIFNQMHKLKIKSSLTRNSAISFSLCISYVTDKKLREFIETLGRAFEIEVYKDLQLITIRHFKEKLVKELTENKVILFEETLNDTIQLVVRPALALKEKTS